MERHRTRPNADRADTRLADDNRPPRVMRVRHIPTFSHPDYHRRPRNFTGVCAKALAGYHRRYGITPIPEGLDLYVSFSPYCTKGRPEGSIYMRTQTIKRRKLGAQVEDAPWRASPPARRQCRRPSYILGGCSENFIRRTGATLKRAASSGYQLAGAGLQLCTNSQALCFINSFFVFNQLWVIIASLTPELVRNLSMNTSQMQGLFDSDGFLRVPQVLDVAMVRVITAWADEIEASETEHRRADKVFAARDIFARDPRSLAVAAEGPLLELAQLLAGPGARPTKATLFDKRPEANWTLPLHQDLTITVRERADVPGYTHWSVKAGVPHVQPPVAVLERIVALRVHLDDCPVENGALDVVPGSHRLGRISARALRDMHTAGTVVTCPALSGDVLAMRPLLVHGSRKARVPGRRRVLHIEYSADELDAPLKWPEWCIQQTDDSENTAS